MNLGSKGTRFLQHCLNLRLPRYQDYFKTYDAFDEGFWSIDPALSFSSPSFGCWNECKLSYPFWQYSWRNICRLRCLRVSFAHQTFSSWSEPIDIDLPISVSQFTERVSVQASAERQGLGCVNSLPGSAWLLLSKQPRLFADLCTSIQKMMSDLVFLVNLMGQGV